MARSQLNFLMSHDHHMIDVELAKALFVTYIKG